ncbi:hypothetical protein AGMMS50222_09150 [Endomicrobiia bacterium]|nr:hypothetical protein AGMMS50222_09150 [Endomicrobiia bacterium]
MIIYGKKTGEKLMKMKTKAMLSVIVLFGLVLSSCGKKDADFVSRRHTTPEGIEETKEAQRAKEEEKRKKAEAEAQIRKAKEIKKAAGSSSSIPSSGGPSQSLNPRPSSSSLSSNKLPPSPPQQRQYSIGKGIGAGMGDTGADGCCAFSSSPSSSDGSSSSSSSSPSSPPLIKPLKCSTIRLYTDGKTYCSYKTENSSKFALVAHKYGNGVWMLPANYFDELPVGSLYIRVGKVIDQTNKIHVEIICKKEGDARTPVREAKFIRSKPNDSSSDEWTPDSDGFRTRT